MKWLLLSAILLNCVSAFAENKCGLYVLKGFVVLDKNGMSLIVARKTMSEKKFPVHYKLQNDFAPYVDRFVSGTFVVGDKILALKNIKDAVPDPLNQNQNSTMKKLKDETCPKL